MVRGLLAFGFLGAFCDFCWFLVWFGLFWSLLRGRIDLFYFLIIFFLCFIEGLLFGWLVHFWVLFFGVGDAFLVLGVLWLVWFFRGVGL